MSENKVELVSLRTLMAIKNNHTLVSTPEKNVSRRTAWWWPALSALLAAGVGFVWLCARPGGCQIGSHVVTVTTETLGPSHLYYDEPSGIKTSCWDGPTGSFSSGNVYGLKLGHWMLRLDIIEDPIETTRRRMSKTVPNLIAVLDSDNRFEQMAALEELGKLGASALPALPALIGRMDKNDYSPVNAISMIAAQAGAAALPALTNGLKSSSAFARARIAELLPTLGEAFRPSVPALRQCLTEDVPSSPLKKPPGEGTGPTMHADFEGNLVGRVPSRGERDVFEQAASVRIHVALALWRFTGDTNEPVPVLAALLSDRDPQIAAGAAAAPGEMRLQAQAAAPALTTALRNNDSMQTLTDCLPDDAGRLQAVKALAEIGPPAKVAIPALEAARSDRVTSVRNEIETALTRITAASPEENAK